MSELPSLQPDEGMKMARELLIAVLLALLATGIVLLGREWKELAETKQPPPVQPTTKTEAEAEPQEP